MHRLVHLAYDSSLQGAFFLNLHNSHQRNEAFRWPLSFFCLREQSVANDKSFQFLLVCCIDVFDNGVLKVLFFLPILCLACFTFLCARLYLPSIIKRHREIWLIKLDCFTDKNFYIGKLHRTSWRDCEAPPLPWWWSTSSDLMMLIPTKRYLGSLLGITNTLPSDKLPFLVWISIVPFPQHIRYLPAIVSTLIRALIHFRLHSVHSIVSEQPESMRIEHPSPSIMSRVIYIFWEVDFSSTDPFVNICLRPPSILRFSSHWLMLSLARWLGPPQLWQVIVFRGAKARDAIECFSRSATAIICSSTRGFHRRL